MAADPAALASVTAQLAALLGVAEAALVVVAVDANSVDVGFAGGGLPDGVKAAMLEKLAADITGGVDEWAKTNGVDEARMRGLSSHLRFGHFVMIVVVSFTRYM